MKIFWSERSLMDLNEIFEFYSELAGEVVAQNIVFSIVDKAEILSSDPKIGQIQFFEQPVLLNYRYLIIGNHKIIYRIEESQYLILISRVFDTRRDPKKLMP